MVNLCTDQEPLVLNKSEEYGYLCAGVDLMSVALRLESTDPNRDVLIDAALFIRDRLDKATVTRNWLIPSLLVALTITNVVLVWLLLM